MPAAYRTVTLLTAEGTGCFEENFTTIKIRRILLKRVQFSNI
jgi:hypothetical protein